VEFIFVENSNDTSIEEALAPLIRAGFRVILLYSENHGFGAGCNLGATRTSGARLAFINPDITFSSSLKALIDHPIAKGWGTVRQLNGRGKAYSLDLLPEYKGFWFEFIRGRYIINLFPRLFASKFYVVGSFFWVSRAEFEIIGKFNELFFLYYEEAELSRRLQGLGPPEILEGVTILHIGLGSHTGECRAREHQWDGFVEYCNITEQPELFYRQIRVLRWLGRFSAKARRSLEVLSTKANSVGKPRGCPDE
jgi:GT2 family glycosyltransferase